MAIEMGETVKNGVEQHVRFYKALQTELQTGRI
jgi:hypothetical protein